MPFVQNPDGTSAWVDDAGAPMFGVPQQASGPAALLAMQSDVDAGIKREPGYYSGIASGRPPSMAMSPDALADASGAVAPGSKALGIADVPIGSGAAGAPGGAPQVAPEPQVGWQAEAVRAVAPRPGQSPGPGATGTGGGGPGDPAAWAKAAAAADTAHENEVNAVIAKDNAERAAKGLPPVKLPGQAQAADAGGKAAPGKVIMATQGGQPSAGASGQGGGFDPMAAYLSQFGHKQVGGGKAGYTPSTRTVQREGTQSNETLGLQIGADQSITKAQQAEATTRSVGAQAASKVFDDMVAEDRTAQDAVARSGAALAERTNAGLADISQRIAELKSAEVDPGRKWKSLGPGGQLAQTLAIVAGQIGAAMMKSDKNMVLDIIQQGIDRDVESQRYNLEHKRKGIGDEEKLLQLNKDRFSNEAAALDAQRALGLHAATSRLEALKQATQSQLERDTIATAQAQLEKRAADLIAGVEAKQAGTVHTTEKYSSGQGGGGGPKPLSFGDMLAYGKYQQDKNGAGQKPLNTVTDADGTVYAIQAGEGESGKLRETQGIINSTFDQIRSIHPSGVDAVIDPKLASSYARIVGAGVNKAIGEGSMTADNEQAYARDLTGMRADAAQKFTENFLRNISQRRIQQVAVGTVDARTGAVVPLAGRERMAPKLWPSP